MKTFFSADHHLSHYRLMVEYCKRPFGSIKEMNEAIINNHNSVVKPEDNFYIIGDFAFVKAIEELENLIDSFNGRKHFIIGSHDKIIENNYHRFLRKFVWIKEKAEIKVEGQEITLCHYPMFSWAKSHYGTFSLFGHHHGNLNKDHRTDSESGFLNLNKRLQMDVGVDCEYPEVGHKKFFPLSFEQIKELMSKKDFTPINKRERK